MFSLQGGASVSLCFGHGQALRCRLQAKKQIASLVQRSRGESPVWLSCLLGSALGSDLHESESHTFDYRLMFKLDM